MSILADPRLATREQVTEAVVEWRAARADRLAAEKAAAKIKEREMELKSFLIAAFQAQAYEGIVADQRITGVSTNLVPVVEDRQAFERFVWEEKALDLLQFRLSTSSVREREEAGQEIPGIGHQEVYDLFDRKA